MLFLGELMHSSRLSFGHSGRSSFRFRLYTISGRSRSTMILDLMVIVVIAVDFFVVVLGGRRDLPSQFSR